MSIYFAEPIGEVRVERWEENLINAAFVKTGTMASKHSGPDLKK